MNVNYTYIRTVYTIIPALCSISKHFCITNVTFPFSIADLIENTQRYYGISSVLLPTYKQLLLLKWRARIA
jgi:hypothetical protein